MISLSETFEMQRAERRWGMSLTERMKEERRENGYGLNTSFSDLPLWVATCEGKVLSKRMEEEQLCKHPFTLKDSIMPTPPGKSVLDGIPIKETGRWPAEQPNETRLPPKGGSSTSPRLFIVGHCPTCNAPIYGKDSIEADEQPVVKFTCDCHPIYVPVKSFEESVQIK